MVPGAVCFSPITLMGHAAGFFAPLLAHTHPILASLESRERIVVESVCLRSPVFLPCLRHCGGAKIIVTRSGPHNSRRFCR